MIVKKNLIFTCLTLILIGSAFSRPNGSTALLDDYITKLYSDIEPLDGSKPAYDLFERGMIGYLNLKANGTKINNEKLTVVDFRLSANTKRMWIIDLAENKVLHHRLVSHGKNTGSEYAEIFSNVKNSNTSSLGFYLTGENYMGKYGFSMRLDGVEPGFNDRARERAIVMHPAPYVSTDFVKMYGRLGRSFGCPAISFNKHKEIIKGLANQSVLFLYYPTADYEAKTRYNDRIKAEQYLSSVIGKHSDIRS